MAGPVLHTMPETADILRISYRQVKKMVAKGHLDSIKIGRRRLIRLEAIEAMLAELDGASADTGGVAS